MATYGIAVKVDSKNVLKRLANIEKKIEKTGTVDMKTEALWARDQLILNTPKRTGETASAIGITKEAHSKGYSEIGVGMRFIPYGQHNNPSSWKNSRTKNLLDYMMESPRAFRHFRSGNIPVMRNVPIMAIERFKKRVRINFKTI